MYFDECDLTGHSTGFSPLNPAYINSIQTVDGHVGSIISALQSRPNYVAEDWIILITTDHGGIGTGHGGNTNTERKIWWIGSGNNPVSNQLTNVVDPGSLAIGNFNPAVAEGNPSQDDIAVTALDHLFRGTQCDPFNPAWNLDGQSWLDSLHVENPVGISENVTKEASIKIYPNPTSEILTVWFDNPHNTEVYPAIYDQLGNQVKEFKFVSVNKNKLNVDVSNMAKGAYYLNMNIGDLTITRMFTVE